MKGGSLAGGHLLPSDTDGNLPVGGWEQLKGAEAIIFGAPTNIANKRRPRLAP